MLGVSSHLLPILTILIETHETVKTFTLSISFSENTFMFKWNLLHFVRFNK